MNSSAISTWALVFLGAAGALVATVVAKGASNLVKGRSIDEIVNSANAIIEMYEKHVGALELKVGDLETKIAALTAKLEDSMAKNEKLQQLLLAAPAMVVKGE